MKATILLGFSSCIAAASFSQKTDSATFYFNKGMEEKNAQHWLVASKNFDKATTFDPKMTNAWLQNAYANMEMRKTDVAKGHFEKVNERDPNNKEVIKELANLYFDFRQFPKAIEFAGKCGCAEADRIIGLSSYQTEDYGKAVTSLKKVVASNPSDALSTYTLGRTYIEMEQYKEAVPLYIKAIELDPSKFVWIYELGLLYYNQNDFKNAVVYFVKAGDAGYNKGTDYSENLGYAYIYSGEFEKGEKLLLDVLAKKPSSKDILRDIAEAYYNMKQYDKSLDFCQRLLTLDDKDAKALYQAGLCFQKKGQKDKGQGMCDQAIKMDPSLANLRQKNMQMGL